MSIIIISIMILLSKRFECMHTIIFCTGVCLCYLKQHCKSYKLFNKHNKGVELSDITSAENLENRHVKGLGSDDV